VLSAFDEGPGLQYIQYFCNCVDLLYLFFESWNCWVFTVVVVLPDSFRGMGAWRNSTETQKSGHAPRSRPEVKNGSFYGRFAAYFLTGFRRFKKM